MRILRLVFCPARGGCPSGASRTPREYKISRPAFAGRLITQIIIGVVPFLKLVR